MRFRIGLIAGFETDEEQAQAVIAQLFQRFVIEMGAGVAGPGELQLLHALGDFDGARTIDSEGVVIEHPFAHFVAEELLAQLHFANHRGGRLGAVGMTADGLRPEAEGAFRRAAAAGVEGHVRVLQVADEIFFDIEIAMVDGEDAGHGIPVVDQFALGIVVDLAVGVAPAEACDIGQGLVLREIEAGVIEFVTANEIDDRRFVHGLGGQDGDV